MKLSFRNEIFNLCNFIKTKEETKNIAKVVYELNFYSEEEKRSEKKRNKSEFGYIAKRVNNQFYGYLYTDDNVEMYKDDFQELCSLNEWERKIVERGHATISALIENCLEDVKRSSPKMYEILHPYYGYKPINAISEESILSKAELGNVAQAFKGNKIYQKLFSAGNMKIFENISEEDLYIMIGVFERDIVDIPIDFVPEDIREFSFHILNKLEEITDVLMAEIILVVALREMLSIACQLLFVALVGQDLMVLNEDNIIDIVKNQSNVLYKGMTVLIQNLLIGVPFDLIGHVLIIDCKPSENVYIHEFGVIKASTLSFNNELGATTQLSFVTIDEELNPLHNLTDCIIETELPIVEIGRAEDTDDW